MTDHFFYIEPLENSPRWFQAKAVNYCAISFDKKEPYCIYSFFLESGGKKIQLKDLLKNSAIQFRKVSDVDYLTDKQTATSNPIYFDKIHIVCETDNGTIMVPASLVKLLPESTLPVDYQS